jgi:hypothetical protein
MEFTATITSVRNGDRVSGLCGHRILVTKPIEPVDDNHVDVWLQGMPDPRRVPTTQEVLILRDTDHKPPYSQGDLVRVLVYDNGTVLAPATVAACASRDDGEGWDLTVDVEIGGQQVQRRYPHVNNQGGHDYVLPGHGSGGH